MTPSSAGAAGQPLHEVSHAHGFGYQQIDLPGSRSIPGVDRSPTAEMAFPDDLSGKTVLDVGCRDGYFCFDAVRRGAKRVLGVDVDPNAVRNARRVAESLGIEAEFEVVDFEKDSIPGKFDYVLGLNLLHHLRNPLAALDRLIALTNERLVLEIAALSSRHRRKLGLPFWSRRFLNQSPLMIVNSWRQLKREGGQTFFITSSALENLLLHHRSDIARVKTLPSPHKDGRFVAIVDRRRVGRMIVVAGPTSSGKSTVCDRIMARNLPDVADRLGIEDGSSWSLSGPSMLQANTEPVLDKVLFHYDFLNPYLRSAQVYERDTSLGALDTAEQLEFLTIWTPPDRLIGQLRKGELSPHTLCGYYYGTRRKLRKRHLKLEKEYSDPARVVHHYRNWFAYAATQPGEHHVVCVSEDGSAEFQSVDEWQRMAAQYV